MITRRYYVPKIGKIAYLNNAKCACTSIKTALACMRNGPIDMSNMSVHDPLNYGYLFHKATPEESDLRSEWVRFTFVRDPFTRVLSFYKNKVLVRDDYITGIYEKFGVREKMSFQEFVSLMVTIDPEEFDEHLYPQSSLVFDGDRPLVDFIGKLEDMGAGWRLIEEVTGRRTPLRNANSSTKLTEPVEYSDEDKSAIYKHFFADAWLFGYLGEEAASRLGDINPLKERMPVVAELMSGSRIRPPGPDANAPPHDVIIYEINKVLLEVIHLRRQSVGINNRLDKYLQRLERLEHEVHELARQAEQ